MNRTSSWLSALSSLLVPICIGMTLYIGLSYAIDQGHLANETILRYLTGHPVSHVTTAMFLIGIASLVIIGWDVTRQTINSERVCLGQADLIDNPLEIPLAEQAERQLDTLSHMSKRCRDHYLWQRLVDALEYVWRNRDSVGIEEELKYLSEAAIDQQQRRYSLARILIWATPMLGFLGTVLGISQALGGIQVGPDNDFQAMMNGLRGNLYIAFDTTALALTLSMVMMFCLFLVEKFETQLLLTVDSRAKREIAQYFEMQSSSDRFADRVLEATRESVEQQTKIWRTSIQAAEKAWAASLSQSNEQVQESLSEALDENVANLAHYLGETIERADTAMSHRWAQWQVTLSDNARMLSESQTQLANQTETLNNLIANQPEDASLESALGEHLNAIQATQALQQTLASLAETLEQSKPTPHTTTGLSQTEQDAKSEEPENATGNLKLYVPDAGTAASPANNSVGSDTVGNDTLANIPAVSSENSEMKPAQTEAAQTEAAQTEAAQTEATETESAETTLETGTELELVFKAEDTDESESDANNQLSIPNLKIHVEPAAKQAAPALNSQSKPQVILAGTKKFNRTNKRDIRFSETQRKHVVIPVKSKIKHLDQPDPKNRAA